MIEVQENAQALARAEQQSERRRSSGHGCRVRGAE